MKDKALSLYELNTKIKNILNDSFCETYWVVAEISEVSVTRSEHCYLELIEKDEKTDELIAKARGTIWAYTFRMLKPYFETTTGHKLSKGLKILINVQVEFHELYGYSLNIKDIDPTYTLGDLAKKRREIIERLENEGVIDMNKELSIPLIPQKIAIISSETAAGYGDWVHQIENNQEQYKFYYKLFPAVMQGNNAEESIIEALNKIYPYEDFFDLVAIIRGGGSQAELSCFDNYSLAYHITQFPLPVISGIGHERDDTIVDIVAHTKMKTPTAVAEFLISKVSDFENHLNSLQNNFVAHINNLLFEQKSTIELISNKFSPLIKRIIEKENSELNIFLHQLKNTNENFITSKKYYLNNQSRDIGVKTTQYFLKKKHELEIHYKTADYLNPKNVLKRGYSITLFNGKIVKTVDKLKKDDIIDTKMNDGTVESKVRKIRK